MERVKNMAEAGKIYKVLLENEPAGQVTTEDMGVRVKFTAQCVKSDNRIYRLYCQCGGKLMLIGVLMPKGGSLQLTKIFTKNELAAKGITEFDGFFMSDREPAAAPPPKPMEIPPAEEITAAVEMPVEEISAVEVPVQMSAPEKWQRISDARALFADAELADACANLAEAYIKDEGRVKYLAISASPDKPFPLMPIFCFGEQQTVNGQISIVFKIVDGNLV